jgi:hypothetical protein
MLLHVHPYFECVRVCIDEYEEEHEDEACPSCRVPYWNANAVQPNQTLRSIVESVTEILSQLEQISPPPTVPELPLPDPPPPLPTKSQRAAAAAASTGIDVV